MARVVATKTADNIAEANAAVRDAERALAAARNLLEEASKPQLREPSLDLIRFSKRFRGSSTVYAYAALRTGGLWYLTGAHSPQGITWRKLAQFIAKDNILDVSYIEQSEDTDDLPF